MPGRIRYLHRKLVGELALAVFREAGASDRPGCRVFGTGDDADPDTARPTIRSRGGGVLGRRLGILDRGSAQLPRCLYARFRRPGNEHARSQVGRQRRRQLQVRHLVIAPFEADRIRRSQQALNDGGVLHQPRIALVVGRQVVERGQIVLESPRHHVEIDAPAVQVRERRDHLGNAVRVHIDRLDRHQRAQSLGGLDDHLRNQPWIQLRIVGKHQHAFAACVFAPARDFLQLADARLGLRQGGRRASREDLQAVIGDGSGHIECLRVM